MGDSGGARGWVFREADLADAQCLQVFLQNLFHEPEEAVLVFHQGRVFYERVNSPNLMFLRDFLVAGRREPFPFFTEEELPCDFYGFIENAVGESQLTIPSRRFFYLDEAFAKIWFQVFSIRLDEFHVLVAKDKTEFFEIKERNRDDLERFASLIKLSQLNTSNKFEILDFAMHEAIRITQSQFGYIYNYDEETRVLTLNSWSREVMSACTVIRPQTEYALEKTGLWGDAIRQRRPVITNDYLAAPSRKGVPEGHVPIVSHMNVPVFNDGRIVALIGVANRELPYDQGDVDQLQLLMESVWRILEVKRHREQIHRLSIALENSPGEIYMFDEKNLVFEYANRGALQNLGYSLEELKAVSPLSIKPALTVEQFDQLLAPLREGRQAQMLFDTVHRRKDGSTYPVQIALSLVDTGAGCSFLALVSDITERKRFEAQLRHLAGHDPLTGLANRSLLQEQFARAIDLHGRAGKRLGVALLDIDNFKLINDTLGHLAGDQLIRTIAERIASCVRRSDTVSRFGGDEFVCLFPEINTPFDLAHLAKKLHDEIVKPVSIEGRELFVTASTGLALFPDDGTSATELIKQADTAMYHVKNEGKNAFHFFTREMNGKVRHRLEMERQLREAIGNGEFFLQYQPLVHYPTQSLFAVEALLRWRKADGTLVAPDAFIPILEETGLLLTVGQWVLREAFARTARFSAETGRALGLAVNISPMQFHKGNLYDTVCQALEETGFPPRRLKVEITEGTLMKPTAEKVECLAMLRALGVKIAIDDFGTGYSSLNYLKNLPIDEIKIDRSFIGGILANGPDASIVKTIIAIASNLKLSVIAEGVECGQQASFLEKNRCKFMQGFYFSRPVEMHRLRGLRFPCPIPATGAELAG
jgi:diguanylate cyclase (GGDEF)-like protein/PAS domain S-box-containing protein